MPSVRVSLVQATAHKADRALALLLWLHFIISLCLAPVYGTWGVALIVGGGAALVPTILRRLLPGSMTTRLVVAAAYMIFSALFIHQMQRWTSRFGSQAKNSQRSAPWALATIASSSGSRAWSRRCMRSPATFTAARNRWERVPRR